MEKLRNSIVHGNCIDVLKKAEEPFVDLIFADPPFNIGYQYDQYDDNLEAEKYLAWSRRWIEACRDVLKPHGSFYLAIGDKHAAELKIEAEKLGFVLRNWIIWHYTFGQQMRTKYSLSHTHIFYFVKDPANFVFNDAAVRVISDRQKKYRDKRANPDGKMPDDVWDEYVRICGTFGERTGFPCQMPEALLARIIRLSSNEGDWVLDPFNGSGTTAVVAHKLRRDYTGVDISEDYVKATRKRIEKSEGLPIEGETPVWSRHAEDELQWLYRENKVPDYQLSSNKMLLSLFTRKLNARLQRENFFTEEDVIERLKYMRRHGKLAPLKSDLAGAG